MSKHIYRGNSPRLTNGKHYEVLGTENNPYRDGADYVFVKDENGCGIWVKSSEFGEKAQ
ncbi:hypothetical protein [Pantoea sp.]|uniref:hypothetical protein n=1 Tax=Pantoea sp. TaxID=69393 RepID=UPI0031E3FD6C